MINFNFRRWQISTVKIFNSISVVNVLESHYFNHPGQTLQNSYEESS